MSDEGLVVRVVTAIAAPPERVWEILADLPGYRDWHPNLEILSASRAAEQPVAVGSVLRLRTNAGTTSELEFDVTVTALDEPFVLAWEGGDPEVFHGRHRFTLIPAGGQTHLVNEESFTGAVAEAVLAQQRAAIEAQYAAADAVLKAVAQGAG
jgi:uncharacterized protein YndB with AHSA1/START domain